MTDPSPLARFVLARIAEREAAGWDLADCTLLRDLVEWALGVEELRRLGDVGAPLRPVGVEVLRMLAERWGGHAGFDPGWLTP